MRITLDVRANSRRAKSASLKYGRLLERSKRRGEIEYAAMLLGIVDRVREVAENKLFATFDAAKAEAVGDGMARDAQKKTMEQVLAEIDARIEISEAQATRMAKIVALRNAKGIDAAVREAMMDVVGINVKRAFKSLAAPMAAAIKENVELIQSIPVKYSAQVADIVKESMTSGMRWETMTGEMFDRLKANIKERGDVAASRARLIARDQTSKMNGAFNQARQRDLGVTRYEWQTSGDDRVRDEHEELDGQIFSWDNPPAIGHPGDDYQCRCNALAIFEDIENAEQ